MVNKIISDSCEKTLCFKKNGGTKKGTHRIEAEENGKEVRRKLERPVMLRNFFEGHIMAPFFLVVKRLVQVVSNVGGDWKSRVIMVGTARQRN